MRDAYTPHLAIELMMRVLDFGQIKHAGNLYQNGGHTVEHQVEKALGHLEEHLSGSPCDHETRITPLAHAMARIAMAIEIAATASATSTS